MSTSLYLPRPMTGTERAAATALLGVTTVVGIKDRRMVAYLAEQAAIEGAEIDDATRLELRRLVTRYGDSIDSEVRDAALRELPR